MLCLTQLGSLLEVLQYIYGNEEAGLWIVWHSSWLEEGRESNRIITQFAVTSELYVYEIDSIN